MPIRVDFRKPIDGASGRVDLMRVLAANTFVPDDFDARVIFSSNYPSAQAEAFAVTVANAPGTGVSGSVTLARPYPRHPLLLLCYATNAGAILFPYFYNQYFIQLQTNGSQTRTLERQDYIGADTVNTGGNNYRVDWTLRGFNNSNIGAGVLYIKAIGQGI